MTNQQGAPEALRVEAAYGGDDKFIGYRLLSSGANGGLLVWADQKAMPGFRIGDHFVPGYQEVIEYKPVALVEAQQPAPSAAAEVDEVPLPLLVRDIAADLGTTPIQVCTALAALGFGGHSVNMAVTPRMAQSLRAHFASPTPQADSQPAPDPADVIAGALQTSRGHAIELMRQAVDADRAARAPADSVTAPAATPTAASIAWTALRDLTDPLGEAGVKIMGHVRIYAQRQYEAGLTEGRATPPTQAADSVPEDAETALRKVLGVVQRYLPPDGPSAHDSLSEIIEIVDPWPLAPLEKP